MAGKSGGADPGPKTRTFRLPTGVEWTIFALCALLGLGAAMLVRAPGPVGDVLWRLELTTYDWRLRLRAVEPRSKDIVIVGVDNTSLQMVGSWPWPREYHAELVDALHRAGARVVMFDMLFDLPSSRGPFVNGISRDDLAFADAIKRAGNVVLICEVMLEQQGRGDFLLDANVFLKPIELLADPALGAGVALVPEDVDGVVRRVKLAFRPSVEGAAELPFVGLVSAAYALGMRPADLLACWLRGSHRDHPWMDGADFLIDYRAPPTRAYTYLPYVDVLAGQCEPDAVRDKIVLVGMFSGLEPDLKLHPVGAPVSPEQPEWWMRTKMPGVEVIANITDMLLENRAVAPAPVWCLWALPILHGLLVALLVTALRLRGGLLGTMVAGGSHWLVAAFGMIGSGVWMPVVSVWGAEMLAYIVAATLLWFLEERHTYWLRESWGKRVSPEILDLILANPGLRHVPGRRVVVSVMFVDLTGSTALSTEMEPDRIVHFLDQYLTLATEVIRAHRGTVHKFIGDGVMAVFGDPIPLPDHAQHAVDAAFDFHERMQALTRSILEGGGPELRARVGIHSGEVVAGDVGPPGMLEYTVIGETVNVAARMEALNKELGTPICVSAETYALLTDPHDLVYAGAHEVRGVPDPVPAYAKLAELKEEAAASGSPPEEPPTSAR